MTQSRDRRNPFTEPSELDNPFQDPAVIQHQPSWQDAKLDVYNPFETRKPPPAYEPPAPAPLPPSSAPSLQSSRELSPTEPKNYGSYITQASAAAATAELLKKQEELNQKAEEVDPRDTLALLLNFLACLTKFCVETSSGSGFGLSILWILLFTPCSLVCWYRPMYKAFQSDSSFSFFIFFAHDVLFFLQAIGIPGWGFSGWISALEVLSISLAVAVLMLLVAPLFTGIAVLGIVMLKQIHSLYRCTSASFQKAQQEFSAGVFSNPAV
ncbi:Secretory carrier-associated membrane protein 3 [Saguinus oedipus]|uniref:Secretory carrier-associated membrane protein n=1 Tax=Saguinus oedipus TaxID=9490 RepID=A0ABQ9W166_SAGOE|nr:Secretory carrier-associated membrane protein 3 [Saguinus oedipus]